MCCGIKQHLVTRYDFYFFDDELLTYCGELKLMIVIKQHLI